VERVDCRGKSVDELVADLAAHGIQPTTPVPKGEL
jgi:hypothetical protein